MSPIIDEVVQFCKNALSSGILGRDDYKDCAETVLLVLGHPPDNYTFKSPIGISKTRWMAKIVYGLKIFLFRDALKLPGDEKNKFERLKSYVIFNIVTGVEIGVLSANFYQKTAYINKPFLFFIRDRRSENILFAGNVKNPIS